MRLLEVDVLHQVCVAAAETTKEELSSFRIMKELTPEVVFVYSSIYDRMLCIFAGKSLENIDFKNRKEYSLGKIKKLKKDLKPILPKILKKISLEFGISWSRKEIRIYVLPNWHSEIKSLGFSDPLTIVLKELSKNKAVTLRKEIVDYIIIHELCHVIQNPLQKTSYFEDVKKEA